MSLWSKFYEGRMGERYQRYVKVRYEPFLRLIENSIRPGDAIVEVGCGIGSITRALMDRGQPTRQFRLVDNDPEMLALAENNTGVHYGHCWKMDVRNPHLWGNIHFGHGLLEHFGDFDINRIVNASWRSARAVFHYVPSAKYLKPSFGDERLMSPEQWQKICQPTEIVEFNNGYDLALIWRFR